MTSNDYSERRTFRDALDSLLARVRGGDDVDPAELADIRAKANAEAEVETGRRSKHERAKTAKRQAEARAAITAALADLDPDAGPAARARIEDAYGVFLDVLTAEVIAAEDHKRKLADAVRPYRDTGLELLPEDYMPRRGWPEDVDPANHIKSTPGFPTSWIMWGGVRYSAYALDLKRWASIDTWKTDMAKARERAKKN